MACTLDRALAAHALRLIHIVLPCLKTTALRARLWFSASCEAVAGISPSSRAPAAPLAGALLISISAVSVSCCAHLSAPDVWQIAVLGAAASIPSHAGNARLLSTSLSSGTAGAELLRNSAVTADPLTRCRFVWHGCYFSRLKE